MAQRYLLSVRGVKGLPKEFHYLTLDEEGGWYTSKTCTPEGSKPAPPGMNEAVNMWFTIAFKYADLNLREFLIQMGVEL